MFRGFVQGTSDRTAYAPTERYLHFQPRFPSLGIARRLDSPAVMFDALISLHRARLSQARRIQQEIYLRRAAGKKSETKKID